MAARWARGGIGGTRRALLVVALLLGFAPGARAASFWGVDGGSMLAQPAPVAAEHIGFTRAVGISLARFAVTADSDNQLAALAGHGIEPYPILSGDYGGFAARYGVGGAFWSAAVDPVHIYEIGNEPNFRMSPSAYAGIFNRPGRRSSLRMPMRTLSSAVWPRSIGGPTSMRPRGRRR